MKSTTGNPQPGRHAVTVDNLRKTYAGGVEAVRGVSFDVAPGEVFGLLGPNGAGKSTLVGMLTTTIRPTGGTATVAGIDIGRNALAARARSSIVFQDAVVDRTLTGWRNLDIHARLWGVPGTDARQLVDDLAPALGVAEILGRPVATYSGGQRRRLEILRALVSRPEVLFLDEPTVGLDPRIRYELLDVIADLRARDGTTIMLTTHYLDEAERLCDRIAVIHEGSVVALDSPARLLRTLGDEILELRLGGDPEVALRDLRGRGLAGDDALAVGSTVTVPLRRHSGIEAVAAVTELGILAHAVSARRPTLDDVYLRLTGATLAA